MAGPESMAGPDGRAGSARADSDLRMNTYPFLHFINLTLL